MTGIDRLSGATPIGANSQSGNDARSLAAKSMGELGQRVLAWVGASGGSTAGAEAFAASSGVQPGFRPDAATLARGGDIYGIDTLAGEIAGQTGASPTQEGDLRRALQDFTRAAVVQVAGLSGAPGEHQVAGIQDAMQTALAAPNGDGIDGVIARVDQAAAQLNRANAA